LGSCICLPGLAEFLLTLLDDSFVLGVELGGGGTVPFGSVLGTGCGIFLFFCVDDLVNLLDHVTIFSAESRAPGNNRVKLTSATLLLEMGDLVPYVIRDSLVATEGLQRAGKAELCKESSEHRVSLPALVEVLLKDHVQLLGEHLDILSHLGRNQMPELGIKFRGFGQLCLNVDQLDEVLRVERFELFLTGFLFIVDSLVVIMSLAQHGVNLLRLIRHVSPVSCAGLLYKLISLGQPLRSTSEVCSGNTHSLAFVSSLFVERSTLLIIGDSFEVSSVVS